MNIVVHRIICHSNRVSSISNRMRNFLSTVMIGAALLIGSIAYAQPKMEIIGGETCDWGKVTVKNNPLKMVSLDTAIWVKNVGTKDLVIDTIRVGCGCTTPHYNHDPIKPGETGKIGIGLNVALASGELTKTMTIYANDDPSKMGKLMYLKANIFRPLTLTPQSFNFPEIHVGDTSHFFVNLKNNDTKPFKIERMLATKGMIIDQKGPVTIQPGDTLRINGSYIGRERGYWNANVVIETPDPDFPPFEISAYGQVKDNEGVVDPSVITIDPTKKDKKGNIIIPAPSAKHH